MVSVPTSSWSAAARRDGRRRPPWRRRARRDPRGAGVGDAAGRRCTGRGGTRSTRSTALDRGRSWRADVAGTGGRGRRRHQLDRPFGLFDTRRLAATLRSLSRPEAARCGRAGWSAPTTTSAARRWCCRTAGWWRAGSWSTPSGSRRRRPGAPARTAPPGPPGDGGGGRHAAAPPNRGRAARPVGRATTTIPTPPPPRTSTWATARRWSPRRRSCAARSCPPTSSPTASNAALAERGLDPVEAGARHRAARPSWWRAPRSAQREVGFGAAAAGCTPWPGWVRRWRRPRPWPGPWPTPCVGDGRPRRRRHGRRGTPCGRRGAAPGRPLRAGGVEVLARLDRGGQRRTSTPCSASTGPCGRASWPARSPPTTPAPSSPASPPPLHPVGTVGRGEGGAPGRAARRTITTHPATAHALNRNHWPA